MTLLVQMVIHPIQSGGQMTLRFSGQSSLIPGQLRPSKDAACTCTTINGSIMRPTSPTTGKAPPVAGQRFAECTVGEVVMVKYKSSCKANPDWPCDLNCDGSTCWQYVSYRCEARNMRPTMKRPDIRTRWTGGPFPTVLSACSL